MPALCALRNLTLSYITSHHGYEVSKESSLETLKKNLKTRRTNAIRTSGRSGVVGQSNVASLQTDSTLAT